jgi:hypothetical protein
METAKICTPYMRRLDNNNLDLIIAEQLPEGRRKRINDDRLKSCKNEKQYKNASVVNRGK